MRNKRKVSNWYKDKFCNNCIWVKKDGLCPFLRCPRVNGWVVDKNAKEGQKNGYDEARN